MATRVSKTVDTGGTGDYPSLNAAEAANFGAAGAVYTDLDVYIALLAICTNGNADTTACSISGQTTDATHDITITVPVAYRHNGTFPASGNVYRMTSATSIITLSVSNVTINGVSFKCTATGGATSCINAGASGLTGLRLSNLVVVLNRTEGTSDLYGILVRTDTGNVSYTDNCVAYCTDKTIGGNYGIIMAAASTGGLWYVYNCTTVGGDYGITGKSGSGYLVAKNCLSFGNTTDYGNAFNAASTNNGYSNGTGPSGGSNAVNLGTDAAKVFVSYGSKRFDLCGGSLAAGRGADLRGDLVLPVTDDIVRRTRPAVPSLGAFEAHQVVPGCEIYLPRKRSATLPNLAIGRNVIMVGGRR